MFFTLSWLYSPVTNNPVLVPLGLCTRHARRQVHRSVQHMPVAVYVVYDGRRNWTFMGIESGQFVVVAPLVPHINVVPLQNTSNSRPNRTAQFYAGRPVFWNLLYYVFYDIHLVFLRELLPLFLGKAVGVHQMDVGVRSGRVLVRPDGFSLGGVCRTPYWNRSKLESGWT
jgi:hypothetical protein